MEVVTLSGTYQDSVKLMRIANEARQSFDVEEAVAMMGTEENKDMLTDLGTIEAADLESLQPDDLILAVEDDDQAAARSAVEWMEAEVSGAAERQDTEDAEARTPKSLYGALDRHPNANLGLISIPGEYATREAWKALHEGLHVHIFSDNVSLEDERKLKEYGAANELLVMGPDAGTAIINGVPLGFANAVDDGSIGVVSAAGSGLQEVTSLIDRGGAGISQAIGTGGRDLKDEVGGVTMQQGIDRLAADDQTEVIVLVSKPPDTETMQSLLTEIEACEKPVVVDFVGSDADPITDVGATPARTLADAARSAVGASSGATGAEPVVFDDGVTTFTSPDEVAAILDDRERPYAAREAIRGLFSGGTLCSEAAILLEDHLPTVTSNVGVGEPMADPLNPSGHAIVDLGTDEFTRGRPHPMIDSTIRDDQLSDALAADTVGVVLLDVILGYGAHDDPAAPIVDVIEAHDPGDWPVVVASVVGTRGDPQQWETQINQLTDAGVYVTESNAAAVELTAGLQARLANQGSDNQ